MTDRYPQAVSRLDTNQSEADDFSHPDRPGEPRYRNSQYFQADRLRCSEAAADLRSVKNLMNALAEAFQQRADQGRVRQPAFVPVIRL